MNTCIDDVINMYICHNIHYMSKQCKGILNEITLLMYRYTKFNKYNFLKIITVYFLLRFIVEVYFLETYYH